MAESRPAGQTKGQEGNAQAVETGIGTLQIVHGHCPVVQGWGQEGEVTDGVELGKGR